MNKDNAKDYLPLVQALAEGRTIQHSPTGSNPWWDDAEELEFTDSPCNYRIKPEPKEFWVNRLNGLDGGRAYSSEEGARQEAVQGAVQVCYREVIE